MSREGVDESAPAIATFEFLSATTLCFNVACVCGRHHICDSARGHSGARHRYQAVWIPMKATRGLISVPRLWGGA
eukprot:11179584-Lingulodinium_polyedra.AAC.1